MANIKTKRIFLALNIPADIKNTIDIPLKKLKSHCQELRIVKKENLHITLFFLGDLTEKDLDKLKISFHKNNFNIRHLKFKINSFGAFPSIFKPKIIFVSLEDLYKGNALILESKIKDVLHGSIGHKDDKKQWIPHITVARVKSNFKMPTDLVIEKAEFKIQSFEIMESKLLPTGPDYKIVASYEL